MAEYDVELLEASRRLLLRRAGQRGKLPSARVRRSVSTTYYALFHFLLEQVGKRIVGTSNDLRIRRRILVRTITHRGAKVALDKIKGPAIDSSVADFFKPGAVAPLFARDLARAFSDAQAKRLDADYDLNKPLSELDGRLLRGRVRRVIAAWRAADSPEDRVFKQAMYLLILLGGKVRSEA